MSFLAKFIIDGKDYNVLECTYAFHQPSDTTGKPTGRPLGGNITLKVESRGDTDLLHWMTSHSQTKEGFITFFKRDAMSRQLEIHFSKAFCIDYVEHFNALSETPMQIKVNISAQELKVGDVTFENLWGVES